MSKTLAAEGVAPPQPNFTVQLEERYSDDDVYGMIRLLKPKVKCWARKTSLHCFGDVRESDDLEQVGLTALAEAVPKLLKHQIMDGWHIRNCARQVVFVEFYKHLSKRPLIHVPRSTQKYRRRKVALGLLETDDRGPSQDEGKPVHELLQRESTLYWEFVEAVGKLAIKLSDGDTQAAIRLMLSKDWDPTKKRWSGFNMTAAAAILGINRRTLKDCLTRLAEPIASALPTELAEVGSLVLGDRWPEIAEKSEKSAAKSKVLAIDTLGERESTVAGRPSRPKAACLASSLSGSVSGASN